VAEQTPGKYVPYAPYVDALDRAIREAESRAIPTESSDSASGGKPGELASLLTAMVRNLGSALSRLEAPEELAELHERLTALYAAVESHIEARGQADKSTAPGAVVPYSPWDDAEIESLLLQAGDVWRDMEQIATAHGVQLQGARSNRRAGFRLL
jgi:hypothetical protein